MAVNASGQGAVVGTTDTQIAGDATPVLTSQCQYPNKQTEFGLPFDANQSSWNAYMQPFDTSGTQPAIHIGGSDFEDALAVAVDSTGNI